MKEDKADLNAIAGFAERQPMTNEQAPRNGIAASMKTAVKVIAINLLIIGVLALIIEAAFGSWFNPRRLNRLNLIRSTTITYSANGLYTPSPTAIRYSRDVYGFRGAYPSPDRIDIMTIGGSTTDQRFITDGDTWQDVLAKEFASQGKTVSVVNAGIDGQSTVGHIRDFDWWFSSIPNLHARYFLFYVGINDFHMEDYNHYDDLLNSNSVMATIRDNSALYYVFRTLRGVYQAQVVAQVSHRAIDFDHIQWTDHGLVSDHQSVMNPRLAGFRERLRILGDKVRALGGVPICVTQTERKFKRLGDRLVGDAEVIRYDQTSINGVDQYQLMKILNQVTLEECHAIGGIGIDLAGELEFNDSDFYDFIHNTPPGAAKVGKYLYSKLKDRL